MDVFDGCLNHCDTCLARALFPKRRFSYVSLKKLFKDKRFLRMLQEDSLRFGSSGDILNHPDAIKIIRMVLWETRILDQRLRKKTKNRRRHVIKIYTNYRTNQEKQLIELLSLASRHKARLKVVISLPLNRSDSINRKFGDFVKKQRKFFEKPKYHSDGMVKAHPKLPNVYTQDVRHPTIIFTTGRSIETNFLKTKKLECSLVNNDREYEYRHRGMVKTYFNPSALWLMIYTTIYESSTTRVFTPFNLKNLKTFSWLPWHKDFDLPTHWKGPLGVEKSNKKVKQLQSQNKRWRRKKYRTIVHGLHK
jgi:hypothetical protein